MAHYFNAAAVAVERRRRQLTGDRRTRTARDTFTYLDLPPVVGIIGIAVGLKVMLDEVAVHGVGRSSGIPALAVVALFDAVRYGRITRRMRLGEGS